jgi:anti-anti-sigma factor
MSGKGFFAASEETPATPEREPARPAPGDFLRLSAVGKSSVIHLTLPELLDSDEFDHLNHALLKTLDTNIKGRWVLDLTRVNYMGSSMLGMMVNVRQHVKTGGGTLALAALSPKLTTIFRTCCLEKLFVIARTADEAVAKLGG